MLNVLITYHNLTNSVKTGIGDMSATFAKHSMLHRRKRCHSVSSCNKVIDSAMNTNKSDAIKYTGFSHIFI